MTEDEKGYNGWTNYETWCAALWMANERGSYDYTRELARDVLENAPAAPQVADGIWTAEQAARFALEDRLKDEYQDAMPEVDGMWSDLLSAAFGEINWLEIAQSILEEVTEDA